MTSLTLEGSLTILHRVDTLRAGSNTLTTANAPLREELELRLGTDAFGIVAPKAAQRASFQEDSGANARSIVDGESLDIEYNACLAHYVSCVSTTDDERKRFHQIAIFGAQERPHAAGLNVAAAYANHRESCQAYGHDAGT